MTSTITRDFRTEHRGAGPRYVARTARRGMPTRYAAGPTRENVRALTARVVTLVTIGLALLVLGLVGRADMRTECDGVWNFASTASAADRMTCADQFPGRYPATDALG